MNYYELLEVRENASPEVVEMAYKALMRKYHPDVCRDDPEFAHDITQKLNEAHKVLADPQARAQYDASLAGEGASENDGAEKEGGRSFFARVPRSAIVLALLCLLLAAAVLILALRGSTLAEENQRLNSSLATVKSTLSTLEENNLKLQKSNAALRSDLNFYYDNASVIADYSKRYHHLGCSYLNPEHAYILDAENADRLGYVPCPHCWDTDFDVFYEE